MKTMTAMAVIAGAIYLYINADRLWEIGDYGYDNGYSEGYMVGYWRTCNVSSVLASDHWDSIAYTHGYELGYEIGAIDCSYGKPFGTSK